MNTVTTDLEAAALSLPASDRARLARRLIESLDQDAEVEASWAEEIARRVRRVESGEARLIPMEEVLAEARGRLGG